MTDYAVLAKDILDKIGGCDNISSVAHCMTRLRFYLKDETGIRDEEVKEIEGVLGVVHAGGQYQVIVGQTVPKVYACVCELCGLKEEAEVSDQPDSEEKKKFPSAKNIGSAILDYVAGSMTPLIPVIVASALFRSVQVLLGPSMLGVISEESDIYLFFDIMYHAFFYFLPVYLGSTAAKKLGVTPVLGMFVACMLLAPQYVDLLETGASFSVYGIPAKVNDYGQSILPVLLSVWVLSYVERFFKRILPDTFSTLFAPFFSMVVMAPAAFCVLAPLGSVMGDYLGSALVVFGEHGGFAAVAVVAAAYEFLVMTGMHGVLILFAITIMMQNGSEAFVLPAAGCATWAVFGVAMGAVLRIRDKKEKSLAVGALIAGVLGGVVEPTLYGVGVKYKRPLAAMAAGGFAGGLYAGLTHVATYVAGSSNFLVVLGYVGGGTANLVNGLISSGISFGTAAVLTYLFGFAKEEEVVRKRKL